MKILTVIIGAVLMTTMVVISCEGGGSNEIESTNKTESSNVVTIGKQVWMTQNLNVDKFRNGDPIPEAKTNDEWKSAFEREQPAYCYYNNNPEHGELYGKLYNWYAVNDSRGLAPEGWKIPSNEEWGRLITFLGGDSLACMKMKYTKYWEENNGESGNGSNESGFAGYPGGSRSYKGVFTSLGFSGSWWSATEYNTDNAIFRALSYSDGYARTIFYGKGNGFSIRCLKSN